VCGDGVVDPNEACDDGNQVETDECLATCLLASCGDGVIQEGVEACDDGNQVEDDVCLNTCALAICGDGFLGPGEACDDGNQVDDDECPSDGTSRDTSLRTPAERARQKAVAFVKAELEGFAGCGDFAAARRRSPSRRNRYARRRRSSPGLVS
jgi:cysteine-rich repeat protein